MSNRLYVYVRADILGPPTEKENYLARLEFATKVSTDNNYFIHTSPNKQDFLEWIHNVAALTTT